MCASLFASLNLFRHQADFVYAGALGDVDHFDYVFVEEIRIGVYKSCSFVTSLENLLELIAQITNFKHVLIDLDRPCLIDRYDDRLVERIGRRRRRAGRWWLRNRRVESLRSQRRDRHEDHEQHKQNIDERSDVDICFGRNLFLSFFHRGPPYLRTWSSSRSVSRPT